MVSARRFARQIAQSLFRSATLGRTSNGVRVLMYHSVDDSGSILSISPDMLRRQVRWLAERGYDALSAAEFVQRVNCQRADVGATKDVFITFDDGYVNVLKKAAPILAEFGMRATVFVCSDLMGRRIDAFERDRDDLHNRSLGKGTTAYLSQAIMACAQEPLMSWQQASDLKGQGFDIESHSACHDFLTSLDDAELVDNLARSREQLACQLGVDSCMIAYPYGDRNAQVVAAAQAAGFQVGVLAASIGVPGDPLQIGRLGMYDAVDEDQLGYYFSAAQDLELSIRRRFMAGAH